MKDRQVHVNIISSAGHTEYTGTAPNALNEIRGYVKEGNKWVYIDGNYTNPDTLTEDDLLNAEDITLTNALAGG